ncbi:MAG TPA: type II toxin-antitoxin system death-on-curing family toxin [Ramlibacter sp.]|nr:type II toxin-antitoxin system death-on-curing family toxin [Ramlibacter sp.]
MSDWIWLRQDVVLAVHDEQLAEHGGGVGVRDASLFESALARPVNLAAYGSPDAADLAAAYAYGISRNHPFIDGNKRCAFVALELFLNLNGFELGHDDVACVMTMLAVATGDMTEPELAEWVRAQMTPINEA